MLAAEATADEKTWGITGKPCAWASAAILRHSVIPPVQIASLPNAGLLEFDQNPNPLRSDLFEEPIEVDGDGTVRMPDRPGLGITLRADTIERYRVERHAP
jgi:L-alanine-DL-glutamate epimerase-like enolase superfamily enzyme